MYGAVDPIYMIQLIKILGKDYIVWDKAAAIQFKKPGRSTLFARFVFTEEEIREIIRLVEGAPSIDRIYSVELKDAEGNVYARMEKTLFIRKKEK